MYEERERRAAAERNARSVSQSAWVRVDTTSQRTQLSMSGCLMDMASATAKSTI